MRLFVLKQEVEKSLMNDIQQLVNQGLWVEEDINEIQSETNNTRHSRYLRTNEHYITTNYY